MNLKRVLAVAVLMGGVLAGAVGRAGATLPPPSLVATRAPLTAVLNGHNEVTAAGVPDQGDPNGTGFASVTVDEAANLVCFELSGVDKLDQPTAAHIHKGAVNTTGAIVVPFTPPPSGAGGSSSSGCVTPPDPATVGQIAADPTAFYVNIHTTNFPGGAIRGQLASTTNRSGAAMAGALEQNAAGTLNQGSPTGAGVAQVWTNTTQSTVCMALQVRGLDPVIAAHIHKGRVGSNGPIVFPVDPPVDGTSFTCRQADPALVADIANDPAGYYANVHTNTFPAGAIRGQLAPAGAGYRMVTTSGAVSGFGQGTALTASGALAPGLVSAAATTPSRQGYWLATTAGGISTFGDAGRFGSLQGKALNRPVIAMAATATGNGYWMAASDGGVFAFGDAPFVGSMGGKALNAPIVGMAATPTGRGYWLVARDGGIFAFGDAVFVGSMGGRRLQQPVTGMAATALGRGYWLVAGDGGIFAFGDAGFFGSRAATPGPTVLSMLPSLDGRGYVLAALDGGVAVFGNQRSAGALANTGGAGPVIAIVR